MNALRSFEAAARHQSFALAAKELSVSAAAVGFQVKRVEEDLGFALFIRKHRAIELTPEGAKLLKQLTKGFDIIESAWLRLDAPDHTKTLKVTAPVAAVKRWLFGEIAALQKQDPQIRISWDMSQHTRPMEGSGPDVAIRYALAPPEGFFAEPILRPWFTPHMRPDIARKILTPADLKQHGLIDVDYGQDNTAGLTAWRPWFIAQGLEAPKHYEMNCADTVTAIDMAVETGHIAMGGYFASINHVKAGQLVAPFDTAVRPASRFWFVCQSGRAFEPEIIRFRQAIHGFAQQLEATARGLEMYDLSGSAIKD